MTVLLSATLSFFLSESQGSWHLGCLAVLLLMVHWVESPYQCPASCLGLNLNSENKEKSRFKKIQISAKKWKMQIPTCLKTGMCSEMVFSWSVWMLGADHDPWGIPRLEPEDSVPWRETGFSTLSDCPVGFPPKISRLVPFHSYWNAKFSHTFLMSSWDKAAFRQPRHQLPLWACRLLIKENIEIIRVLVCHIPVGQLSHACYLYFIPWCVSYRGCETVSG